MTSSTNSPPCQGSTKNRMRVGRGPGSGKGKTAGRGVKGQKARSGVAINGFEGGQMPLHMRMPKRGFNNLFARSFAEVNLCRMEQAIDAGKLDAKAPIDADALMKAGVIRRVKDGVRLLGKGELKAKLDLRRSARRLASRRVAAVEKAGGSVKLLPSRKREAAGKQARREAATATERCRGHIVAGGGVAIGAT